ncbi:hypothetical protein BCR33DRAFT_764777 [Rhizoclosmatium globosum]|uniref:F-box domain-containing protein n=1 Tax=Rhizoclosmatium globosum TaxID=329046 RepID=A0A1Y2CH89_9FUNG|nr:hypothetical protein BCR33DRAFT_764777 [Rhizoclosmatium globosum]|eukprot:ORY46420.1 hypothetical protein BCR33DRAFT_764777 [Rhizoclosmatium globosum]
MDKGLPTELLQEIFSYIPLSKVFQYTRLCKRIHSCLNSSDFARISLQRTTLPRRMNSVCETAEDKLWLYWPRECQKVYAIDILAPLDSLDWNGGSIMSGKPMPPSIGLLIQLKELRMAQNCLFGPIPDELWELAQLLTLDLSFNRLNCTISNEIQNLMH